MKIHMRIDNSNRVHTHITLFIDGKNCGELCLRTDDVMTFQMVLSHGLSMDDDEFISSGYLWSDSSAALIAQKALARAGDE